MHLLGSVPHRAVPTYRAQNAAEIAAVRRRRTVLALSGFTVLGTVLSAFTGLWLLMVTPALLLFGFFVAAWRAISTRVETELPKPTSRLNVSRSELAAKAKEWDASPTVLPNRLIGEKPVGLSAQQMVELATTQSVNPEVEIVAVDTEIETTQLPDTDRHSAAG